MGASFEHLPWPPPFVDHQLLTGKLPLEFLLTQTQAMMIDLGPVGMCKLYVCHTFANDLQFVLWDVRLFLWDGTLSCFMYIY